MVVMLALLARPLEAHHRLSRIDALEQSEALQLVEDPVDARAADTAAAPATQRVLDLRRRERAALLAEQLEQSAAGTAALAAGLRQRRLGVLHPCCGPHASTRAAP